MSKADKVFEKVAQKYNLPQLLSGDYVLSDRIPEEAKLEAYRDALDDIASREIDVDEAKSKAGRFGGIMGGLMGGAYGGLITGKPMAALGVAA